MFIILALQLVGAATPTQPPPAVTEIIKRWLDKNKSPGISVAAVNRSGILWSGGYGLADVNAQQPATATTRYQFASITKVYTALLLAQLSASGQIDLDSPLSRYLPEFEPRYPEPNARHVTLRDIATHTAGFTRDMSGTRASGRMYSYTLEELLKWQRTAGLTIRPGFQYKYSNFGFAVLGAVVERATQKSYRELLRERVLKPLNLTATGFSELRSHPQLAKSYYTRRGKLIPVANPVWDFGVQAAASELISTVEDMARFAHAHLINGDEAVIPQTAIDTLFTPYFPIDKTSAIGLGWHYVWTAGLPRWQHTGSVNHYQSLIAVRPEVGIGLVLASNGPGSLATLVVPLLKMLAAQADTSALDLFTGDYIDPRGTVAMVRRTPEAQLTLEVRGAVHLLPLSRYTFRVMEGLNRGEWVRFVVEDGKMVLLWENRRLVRVTEEGSGH